MIYQDVYDFIVKQEESFKLPIPLADNWEWNMAEHIRLTFLYTNSRYSQGGQDDRPFRNIIRPILNLEYRAEGFDVKDIVLYINDRASYYKSFLLKKYHEKWARENEIDTFIDELVETWVAYGGVLVKKGKQARPEVVPWNKIAFCDQTDILSGPICEKHSFSPEELQEYEGKWENIEEVILLSQQERTVQTDIRKADTPGKYIEVYELHGWFPRYWLYETDGKGTYGGYWYEEDAPENELIPQVHVVTFYKDKMGDKRGIQLFKGKDTRPYRFLARDKIFGRALGFGGAEELFEAQVWTNYSEIRKKELLDQAAKIIYQTLDEQLAQRNNTNNVPSGQILRTTDPNGLRQVDTYPRNFALFEKLVTDWEAQARVMGAANESILGETPASGTPFKLQELITAESHSLHEYRKGKIAVFVDGLYREWIMPHLAKEVTNGVTFFSELDVDEMQYVAAALVTSEANSYIKDRILAGELIEPGAVEAFKQVVREQFTSRGNKKFLEILKGELKKAPLEVEINIAGKQKNLPAETDKLVNIFRTIIANPQVLQSPPMAKLFNQIIEASGLSPVDFAGFTLPEPRPEPQQQQQQQGSAESTKPLEKLTKRPELAEQVK